MLGKPIKLPAECQPISALEDKVLLVSNLKYGAAPHGTNAGVSPPCKAIEAGAGKAPALAPPHARRPVVNQVYVDHDTHNAGLGRTARGIAAERALIDRRLDDSARVVLGAILHHLSLTNQRAWPSYETIGAITGYSDDRIQKAIRQLKTCGYLFSERRAASPGSRAIVHYGLQAMHAEEREALITAYLAEYKRTGIRSKTHPDQFKFEMVRPACDHGGNAAVGNSQSCAGASVKNNRSVPTNANPPALTNAFLPDSNTRYELTKKEQLSAVGAPTGTAPLTSHPNLGSADKEVVERERMHVRTTEPTPGPYGRSARRERFDRERHASPEWCDFAVEIGIRKVDVRQVFDQFSDHHAAKGSVMADWTAAWRTWCRNEITFNSRQTARNSRPTKADWRDA